MKNKKMEILEIGGHIVYNNPALENGNFYGMTIYTKIEHLR